jgi:hypothetical protein
MRNRSGLSQVIQAGFEPEGIAVAKSQALVATADQHDAGGSGEIQKRILPTEKRRKAHKRARATGRPRRLGRPREKLPMGGDAKNGVAAL